MTGGGGTAALVHTQHTLPDGRPVPSVVERTNGEQPLMVPSSFGLDVTRLEEALATLENPKWLDLQKRFAKAYDDACLALLGPNDVQAEGKGANARKFKKKMAWRKLAKHFGVVTKIVGEPVFETVGDTVIARVIVEGRSAWGHSTEAVGACSDDEESGRRTITLADAVATAETRATNRAISNLIAMGEVSYEEVAKNEIARTSPEEITLEEAKAWPYPWKTPPKYSGKPMGNLSENMLRRVRVAVMQELEGNPEKVSLLELKKVTTLLLEDIEEREARDNAEPSHMVRPVPVHEDGYPTDDLAPQQAAVEEAQAEPQAESVATQDATQEREPGMEPGQEEEPMLLDVPKRKQRRRDALQEG